jgi:hypothetical protein
VNATIKMRIASVATAVAAGLGFLASSARATAIVALPVNAVADLTGNASQIMTDVWVLVALAIGIPLGFYIIRKVISLIPKH